MAAITIHEDSTDPRVGTTFTVDGWTVRVDTEPDYDSSTDDADCYTAAQVTAFEKDDWSFVGCVVSVSRRGVDLGSAALGGLEYGWFTYTDDDDTIVGRGYVGPYTEAVDDLIAEAIDTAKQTARDLCAELVSA